MVAPTDPRLGAWYREFATAVEGRADLAGLSEEWPLAYVAEASPRRAVHDAEVVASLTTGEVRVEVATIGPADHAEEDGSTGDRRRLTIYAAGESLSLAQMLPLLQSLGLEVLAEQPYRLTRPGPSQLSDADQGNGADQLLRRGRNGGGR